MEKRFKVIYEQTFDGDLGPEYTELERKHFETLEEAQEEFEKFEPREVIDRGQSNVKRNFTYIATLYDREEQIDTK